MSMKNKKDYNKVYITSINLMLVDKIRVCYNYNR